MAEYTAADTERFLLEAPKTAGLAQARSVGERHPFDRDRARVLHSASFRRLAGKTQVVGPDEDDTPRTRLTHSLEVAQIARDIGTQLGCHPDLVDLAGLAHDIGHPPFGHNGEAALDVLATSAGGFEANAQNLRLLTRLELKVLGPDGEPAGLNLTRSSLDAVIKYPWPRPAGGGKFGVYTPDLAVFEWIRSGVPATARCLEAQVMDWADDVAYSVHDVEDGIMAGRIDLARLDDPQERDAIAAEADAGRSAELRAVLDDLLALPAVALGLRAARTQIYGAAALKAVTSELTGRFAAGAVAATRAAAGGPLTRYAADLVVPGVLADEVALLKAVAVRYVMADERRRRGQLIEQELLAELVAALLDRAPDGVDERFRTPFRQAGSDAERLRVIIDQVSLLTDAQAVHRHAAMSIRRA